jgi:hypothetical protein
MPQLVEALFGSRPHEAAGGGGGLRGADVHGSAVALHQVADDLEAGRPGGVDVAGAVGDRRIRVVDDERPARLQAGLDQRPLARAAPQ